MKYRHSFHAGNFADVHKHVTLLALLGALKRKDKGFLYLDTHAGRGGYDQSSPSPEAAAGVVRFHAAPHEAAELREFAAFLSRFRALPAHRHVYPGSPLIAASALRSQDRAVFVESLGTEARALEGSLAALPSGGSHRARIERGDGFARLRAYLPPPERRALILLDPPYEATQPDFARVQRALSEGLQRFATGVFMAWYPIKDERSTRAWLAECARTLSAPALVSELWLSPRDSKVGLNGSGLLIVNPPYLTLERMQVWLPELKGCLATRADAGARAQLLSESAP
jgi:23S rRNA (adenine2030-N6)-methyltransferase